MSDEHEPGQSDPAAPPDSSAEPPSSSGPGLDPFERPWDQSQGPVGAAGGRPGPSEVPPGQKVRDKLLVKHYGPIPKVSDRDAWAMMFTGHTASGTAHRLTVAELDELPQARVIGALHCASKWSVLDNVWDGVLARDVLKEFPPAAGINDVMVYGQYGYSATLTIDDLAAEDSVVVTRLNGEPLTPEHGFPVRLIVAHLYSYKGPKWFRGWEYLAESRRGFWEERGYHLRGDPWQEERYSYQERHPRSRPSSRNQP